MSLDSNQLVSLFSLNEDPRDILHLIFGKIQKEGSEKAAISALHNLLSSAKTRSVGLEVLQIFILYCSKNSITEHLFEWSSFCMVHHQEDAEKDLKLNTITKILESADNIDLISKRFASEYLNVILKACLIHQSNQEQAQNLKCLSQCMKRFPTWFGNHKDKVELYLVGCLDSSSDEVAKSAASAFLNFLQTGPAGVNGVNYVTNFAVNLKKICASLQKLYNTIFEGVHGASDIIEVTEKVFTFVEDTPAALSGNISEVTAQRILNCLVLLKTLLIKQYSVEKQIVPNQIISVISRGLSRHICFLEVSTNNNYILRKIYLSLLSLLKSYIQGYHTLLMPFSVLIETILVDILSRPYRCDCFAFDINYKILVNKILLKWLTVNKPINDVQFQGKIAPYLLQDLTLDKKTITLNLDKRSTQISPDSNDRLANINENAQKTNCIYALKTLKCLINSSLSFDSIFFNEVVSLVVDTLGRISCGQVVRPYSSIPCQVALYEVLIALLNSFNCPMMLPSLQTIITLLNFGASGSNEKIGRTAKQGLDLLEKISHPVCASLHVCELKAFPERDKKIESPKYAEEKSSNEVNIIENILIRAATVVDEKQAETEEKMELSEIEDEVAEVDSALEIEQKSSENGVKMDDDNDDMFESFQDIVQE